LYPATKQEQNKTLTEIVANTQVFNHCFVKKECLQFGTSNYFDNIKKTFDLFWTILCFFTLNEKYLLKQRSQTRGPRAANGPEEGPMWP